MGGESQSQVRLYSEPCQTSKTEIAAIYFGKNLTSTFWIEDMVFNKQLIFTAQNGHLCVLRILTVLFKFD